MSYTASYIVNSSSAQGTTDFQFTFPYIKEEHIEVYLNYGKITQGSGSAQYQVITNVSPKLIRLNTGTASANLRVEVRRNSSLGSPLVDYADGSTLTANDLDTSALQSLYIDQELKDNQGKTVSVDEATGLPSLGESGTNLRLTKVGDPVSAQDAATKNYVDTTAEPKSDKLTELATMAQNTANALADLTEAEVQALDGLTASTDELNKLDGVTATTAELNYVDGVTSNVQTQLDAKQPLDTELTELATMGSTTASALADLTQAEVQILDGATVSTDELNKLDGITATTAELNYVDGVTSNVQTQLDAKQPLDTELTELATMSSGTASALADLTQAEVETLDGLTATTAELNKLDGVTATTDELNKTDGLLATPTELNTLDGITSNTSELNKLDGVTASTTELNIVAGKSFKTSSGTLDTTSDTEIPSSKVIAAHVASSQTAIGGFTTIADEVSFPNTQPGTGVVVSINNAAGVVINGSGVSTSGKRVDNTTVTINGFPSSLNGETLAAGVGLIVVSTSTANTYSYHKILTSETDVKQLSDDINDFNSRYRIASSAPGSNNDEGDLYFDTAANKMKVYNGSAWDDVASVGSFFITTLSAGSGTGSNTSGNFDGTTWVFALSSPPTFAAQLIVSINGVIQKPNAGTSRPSEGFAVDGNNIVFCDPPPAAGSDYFIVTAGSSVSIGTPSANSVNSSHIIDGSIVNGDISSTANIALSKLDTSGTASNSNYLRGDGAWSAIDLSTKAGLTADNSFSGTNSFSGNTNLHGGVISFSNDTSASAVTWTKADNELRFEDNAKIEVGTGGDLTIKHDGTNSSVVNTTGTLDIQNTNSLINLTSSGVDINSTGNIVLRGGSPVRVEAVSGTSGGQIDLREGTTGGTNIVSLKAPATIASDYTLTLPNAAPAANGQVLSATTAGAASWTTVSAAPEIELVAKGTLPNGCPVVIRADGKAGKAGIEDPEWMTAVTPVSNVADPIRCRVNNTAANVVAFTYIENGQLYAVAAKITDNQLVFGTAVSAGSEFDGCSEMDTCETEGSWGRRIAVAVREGSRVKTTMYRVYTDASTPATVTWGTNTSVNVGGSNNGNPTVSDACQWNSYAVGLVDNSDGKIYVQRVQYSSDMTNISFTGGTVEVASSGRNPMLSSGVGATTARTLMVYTKSGDSDLYAVPISMSGNSAPTIGTEKKLYTGTVATQTGAVTNLVQATPARQTQAGSGTTVHAVVFKDTSNGNTYARLVKTDNQTSLATFDSDTNHQVTTANTAWLSCCFDGNSNGEKLVVAYQDDGDSDKLKSQKASWNGTTLGSFTSAETVDAGDTLDSGLAPTYPGAAGGSVAIGYQITSGTDRLRSKYQKGAVSNVGHNKVIGFSNGAYTDGQTATINIMGNTIGNQSGLTTSVYYYVQQDGTLDTTKDADITAGGIALSATKLLIVFGKGNY